MISLLLLVIFGLGMASFATQNTGVAHIVIANFLVPGVPLYVIVIGSMLLGIFISWLMSIIDTISSTLSIRDKDAKLKEAFKTIDALKKENDNLSNENTRLQEKDPHDIIEENSEEHEKRPSFFGQLKHSFS